MFEQNMETEKLMQSNDATMNVNQTNGIDCTEQKVVECEMGNGGVANGELKEENGGNLTKPELVEMSTSTRSVKCCNGLFNHKFKQKNIVKDNQPPVEKMQSNGTTQNGGTKFNFNTIKAKFTTSNGKYHVNGECGEKMVESFDVEKPVKKVKKCKNKQTTTIEFEDRDPFRINTNAIKYEYLNVFAEPNSGTFSFSPIWSFTNKMYFNLKLYLYRLFAILIGIPCAFVCAIIFALFSVFQIWIFMPLLRMFKTIFGFIREIWFVIIDTVFGPIIQLFLVCRQPQGVCSYRNVGTDSQCQSSVATKSIYDETNLV